MLQYKIACLLLVNNNITISAVISRGFFVVHSDVSFTNLIPILILLSTNICMCNYMLRSRFFITFVWVFVDPDSNSVWIHHTSFALSFVLLQNKIFSLLLLFFVHQRHIEWLNISSHTAFSKGRQGKVFFLKLRAPLTYMTMILHWYSAVTIS